MTASPIDEKSPDEEENVFRDNVVFDDDTGAEDGQTGVDSISVDDDHKNAVETLSDAKTSPVADAPAAATTSLITASSGAAADDGIPSETNLNSSNGINDLAAAAAAAEPLVVDDDEDGAQPLVDANRSPSSDLDLNAVSLSEVDHRSAATSPTDSNDDANPAVGPSVDVTVGADEIGVDDAGKDGGVGASEGEVGSKVEEEEDETADAVATPTTTTTTTAETYNEPETGAENRESETTTMTTEAIEETPTDQGREAATTTTMTTQMEDVDDDHPRELTMMMSEVQTIMEMTTSDVDSPPEESTEEATEIQYISEAGELREDTPATPTPPSKRELNMTVFEHAVEQQLQQQFVRSDANSFLATADIHGVEDISDVEDSSASDAPTFVPTAVSKASNHRAFQNLVDENANLKRELKKMEGKLDSKKSKIKDLKSGLEAARGRDTDVDIYSKKLEMALTENVKLKTTQKQQQQQQQATTPNNAYNEMESAFLARKYQESKNVEEALRNQITLAADAKDQEERRVETLTRRVKQMDKELRGKDERVARVETELAEVTQIVEGFEQVVGETVYRQVVEKAKGKSPQRKNGEEIRNKNSAKKEEESQSSKVCVIL